MKKFIALAALAAVLGLTACSTGTETPEVTPTPSTEAVVEDFSAEYVVTGTSHSGRPYEDTYIFEGKTADGIITELNFDIISNRGTENELSKKDIMGYMMNVSDAAVVKTEDGFTLKNLSANGFEKNLGQYMTSAAVENLTEETTFADLTITNITGEILTVEQSVSVYQFFANEGEIELTAETPVKDLLAIHGLYADGEFKEGTSRVSFAGYNGGRSYGEQLTAIADYILANNMTLEDVLNMFNTVNQQSTPIEDRDVVTGATIAFGKDFANMVEVAINGEVAQKETTHETTENGTVVSVYTDGFGGEIRSSITFDAEGKITAITVVEAQETPELGGMLTAEGSDFINALIQGQADVDAVDNVSGASKTSEALKAAVKTAVEYFNAL